MTVEVSNVRSPLQLQTGKTWTLNYVPTGLWDKLKMRYDTCPGPKTFYVDWGDGTVDSTNMHNYSQKDTYEVTITSKGLYRMRLAWLKGNFEAMNWIKAIRVDSPTLMLLDFALASTRSNLILSNCTNLRYLSCRGIRTDSLDLRDCRELNWLDCAANQMKYLNFKECVNLGAMDCSVNYIDTLDFSSTRNLEYLECESTMIRSLDVSNLPRLRFLYCRNNFLTELDITNNPILEDLYFGANDNLCNLYVKKGTRYEKYRYGLDTRVKAHVKE